MNGICDRRIEKISILKCLGRLGRPEFSISVIHIL